MFLVARSTLCNILGETFEAIWDNLHIDYIKCPSTPEEWKEVARGFESHWDYPNCLGKLASALLPFYIDIILIFEGALDGKHFKVQAPNRGGSLYFNYKTYHSLVLMALVDAHKKVIIFKYFSFYNELYDLLISSSTW